jgi:hypothetical protein
MDFELKDAPKARRLRRSFEERSVTSKSIRASLSQANNEHIRTRTASHICCFGAEIDSYAVPPETRTDFRRLTALLIAHYMGRTG